MQLITPQEASVLLKVHVNTIYRWIEEGNLKAVKISDTWRIDQADIERRLETANNTTNGNGHKASDS